jgi:hypothetical protein
VVTRTEIVTEYNDIALGTFLDIEGTFDGTSFCIIKQAAKKHDIEPAICRWTCAMLECRDISATLSGETLGATAVRVSARKCAVASAVEPGRGRSSLGAYR